MSYNFPRNASLAMNSQAAYALLFIHRKYLQGGYKMAAVV